MTPSPSGIVFLNPIGGLGGGERSLVDVLAVLAAARPEWPRHVIVGADGPLVEEVTRVGATVEVVPMPSVLAALGDSGRAMGGRLATAFGLAAAGLELPGYLRKLRHAIWRARPRVVHSNGIKCHLLAGYAAPVGVPVVWHVRDFLSTRPMIGRWLRRLARTPAVVITNSEAVRVDVGRVLPGVRAETVYNGIDTDFFSPDECDATWLDRAAGLPPAPSGVRVGLVATYARWKGQERFLDAAAQLVGRSGPPMRFYIVGGAVYHTAGSQFTEAELREMIRARGLADIAGLVPFQRDLRPVYRGLDVVVHASTQPEPFGRTIAEAMACGRAVVVSKAGGAAELFTDGTDAIGVPPGDAAGIANAVAELAADPARRTDMGRAARATAVARFSRERMGERLLSVYDEVRKGTR